MFLFHATIHPKGSSNWTALSNEAARFAIAHELAHTVNVLKQANYFAAALLMPCAMFKRALSMCDIRDAIWKLWLAKTFEVPVRVAEVRLQQLEVISAQEVEASRLSAKELQGRYWMHEASLLFSNLQPSAWQRTTPV